MSPRWLRERVRVDLGDDQRHVGVQRKAEELSITIAPAAANRGRPLAGDAPRRPRTARCRSPRSAPSVSGSHGQAVQLSARGALGGERDDLAGRELALAQQLEHRRPDAPVAPTTATRVIAPPTPVGRSCRTSAGAELERVVQRPDGLGHVIGADHARDLDRRGRDHLDVDAPRRRASRNTLAATPGCERMPAPTIETLPICRSVSTCAIAELAAGSARSASSAPRAGPPSRS